MKKTLFFVALSVLTGGLLYAVTQPNSIGVVRASVESKTLAQIDAFTPGSAGQLVFCSNCTRSAICVSSGTGRGAFVIPISTGTFVVGVKEDCL